MAQKTKTLSVEDQLRLLYDLQLTDTRILKLEQMRGELPLEVKYFEDEIAGLETRLEKFQNRITELNAAINKYKQIKAESQKNVERYTEMQKNARNDREFSSLQDEIDFFEGEIVLADKKTKEALVEIAQVEKDIAELEKILDEKRQELKHKKDELQAILEDTEREEEALKKLTEEFRKQLPERLLKAYERLVKKFKNRLAVVTYDQSVAGGSYFVIPPQMQLEIRERDRIIVDEHTGRILVDPELAKEERERMQEIFERFGSQV